MFKCFELTSGKGCIVQYYLVLDNRTPGFDAYFESSAFPRASKQLEKIEEELKIRSHFELFSYAPQNDLCPPGCEETEIPWFDAQEGIGWLDAIIDHLCRQPDSVSDSAKLVDDLRICRDVLTKAKEIGAKWHLEMDI